MRHERSLMREIARGLRRLEGIKVFSSSDALLQGGVLSFVSDKMSAEEIANVLSDKKIAVRSGFHCSPLSHESVGTVKGTVRVSVSDFTDENEVDVFLKTLSDILFERQKTTN